MIGNFAERKYQLAAQKRSEAALKFDYYNQAAKYFERECGKAKQFNNWKVDNLKSTHWDNIRKAEELRSRQNRLKELLAAEEEEYKIQTNQLKLEKKSTKETITLEALKKQLKEKRAEHSLYTPKINRRIQSYFCYPTTQISRSPLKELSNSSVTKSPRMSMENTNLREESNFNDESAEQESKVDYSHVREDFDERASAAKENRFNSLTSNFGHDYNPKDIHYSSVSSRPLSKGHHSNVLYGRQTDLHDDESYNDSNEKFAKRYERATLENTNLCEEIVADEKYTDETDQAVDMNLYDTNKKDKNHYDYSNDVVGGLGHINLETEQYRDKSADSQLQNSESEYPKGQLVYNDQNRSELIFLYLTHKNLMRQIGDLELKEERAILKSRWDDALRLRDMRNRLELMREKEIYQRDDLPIDFGCRKSMKKSIDERKLVLEGREDLCTNSEMYCEDAKVIWDKWVKEDAKAFVIDNQRDIVLQQLEKDWLKLANDDKQKLTYTYNNIMTKSSLQHELKLIAEKISE